MMLIDKIKMYNEAYRNGEPLISDSEYDSLIEQLRTEDPNNEWFQHIEPVQVSNSRKRKLPIPMRSLYKVKSISELKKWQQSLGLSDNTGIVLMPKFDGLSLLVDEFTGSAYSRGGNENEGQDCTDHYSVLHAESNVPTQYHYTYGEFFISRSQWKQFFEGIIDADTMTRYKSPRNTAAGMLNRDVVSAITKHADFYRYGIDEGSIGSCEYSKFSEIMHDICVNYNQEHEYTVCYIHEVNEELLNRLFIEWDKIYPIDGIVVYIDSIDLWKRIGRHSTTGNPLYAVAYKSPDFTESFETTVKSITWNVSKAGALKPVVNIEAVDTGDCTMENPTGYNARWIFENGIAEGARIIVTRSGGVIPKILGTIECASKQSMNAQIEELKRCPSCGSKTCWNDSKVELCCSNVNCNGRQLAKIVYFYKTCNAENMGEETIAKIYNSGFTSISDFLNIKFEDLIKIEGFGVSVSNDILNNNKRIMEGLDMATLMQASDCFDGIAKIKAQKIIDDMPEQTRKLFYDKRYIAPKNDLTSLNKTMQSFYNGLEMFYGFLEQTNIPVLQPVDSQVNTNGIFSGMNICFSGFRNKAFEDLIKSEGGKVVSGVTATTTILVVKDKSATSSKIKKAEALAVVVLDAVEFEEKLIKCN